MAGNGLPLDRAYAECARITRRSARNFYYAFLTLPPARRRALYAVYAYCRLCDDIADEPLPLEEKVARLEEVGEALERAWAGRPQGPIFTALAHTAEVYRIPRPLFVEVLRGVQMDLTVHRYATFEDLRLYCYRVASAVGLISVHIFGFRNPSALAYAEDLGLAMQLTNILRDLREDYERGRIYLPLEEMKRFGYTEEDLAQGVVDERFRALMAFQAERARGFFRSGARLLPLVPPHTRACPAVLGSLYRRLLDNMEARGYDVFRHRPALSTAEKVRLTVEAWLRSVLPQWPGVLVSW